MEGFWDVTKVPNQLTWSQSEERVSGWPWPNQTSPLREGIEVRDRRKSRDPPRGQEVNSVANGPWQGLHVRQIPAKASKKIQSYSCEETEFCSQKWAWKKTQVSVKLLPWVTPQSRGFQPDGTWAEEPVTTPWWLRQYPARSYTVSFNPPFVGICCTAVENQHKQKVLLIA